MMIPLLIKVPENEKYFLTRQPEDDGGGQRRCLEGDNHGWLFGAVWAFSKPGLVTKQVNWYSAPGNGDVTAAGRQFELWGFHVWQYNYFWYRERKDPLSGMLSTTKLIRYRRCPHHHDWQIFKLMKNQGPAWWQNWQHALQACRAHYVELLKGNNFGNLSSIRSVRGLNTISRPTIGHSRGNRQITKWRWKK